MMVQDKMGKRCKCGHLERNHRWDETPTGSCCIMEPNSANGIPCKCEKFEEMEKELNQEEIDEKELAQAIKNSPYKLVSRIDKEFNLSKKKIMCKDKEGWIGIAIRDDDIKEFIRRRNELETDFIMGNLTLNEYTKKRDKLAGEDLC